MAWPTCLLATISENLEWMMHVDHIPKITLWLHIHLLWEPIVIPFTLVQNEFPLIRQFHDFSNLRIGAAPQELSRSSSTEEVNTNFVVYQILGEKKLEIHHGHFLWQFKTWFVLIGFSLATLIKLALRLQTNMNVSRRLATDHNVMRPKPKF